jgi:hypothetical protein
MTIRCGDLRALGQVCCASEMPCFHNATDPRNASDSEHEHYGPYSYLEVMTSPKAGFDHHAIYGSLADLTRLAALVESKLATARPGSTIRIREEFALDSPYALVLDLRDDGFDPAAADALLADSSGPGPG